MSSKFAPPEQSDGDSLLKFAEMEINVIEMVDKNGRPYLKFSFVMTPADPTRPIQTRDFAAFDPGYRAVTWPSITAQVTAGAITAPDDLFTEVGQKAKKFLASYQTPKAFFVATKNDLDFAKQKGTIQDFQTNAAGQYMKPHWPIKIVRIYNDRDQWAADAQAAPQPMAYQPAAPVPVQAAPAVAPEYQAVLSTLPLFVKNSGLDLGRLASMLANPPLSSYFNINSQEVKLEVARQIIAKHNSIGTEIAAFLAGLNGYLTMESPEIVDNLEEVPF